MRKLLICAGLTVSICCGSILAKGRSELKHGDTVYDFGHVGIDYTIYYNFELYNTGEGPVRIKSAVSGCDCSDVSVRDTLIEPGDTAYVRLSYNTRNFFGPTTHSFSVSTDDTKHPELTVYYHSNVGQWVKGIMPDPLALFFLPGQKPKKVTIKNTEFTKMTVSLLDQADNSFSITIPDAEVGKDDKVEITVAPSKSAPKGTHRTCFRLQVDVTGREEPVILTIPVRIVVY
jgi:hypothetical protein